MGYEEIKNDEQGLRELIESRSDDPKLFIKLAKVIWDDGRPKEATKLLLETGRRFQGSTTQMLIQQQIEHMANVEGLWNDVVVETISSGAATKKIAPEYCGHESSEELLENKLWDYANDLVDEKEGEELWWNQIQHCRCCLTKFISIQRILIEIPPAPFSYDEIKTLVERNLSKKKIRDLIGKFDGLITKSPDYVRETLRAMEKNIKRLLEEIVTCPTPSYPTVFGQAYTLNHITTQTTMLSPYGKVRYPIVFEWTHQKGAEEYEISIKGTDWSKKTKETRVEVNREAMDLKPFKEYTWQFKVIKEGKVVEEKSAFFSLPPQEELREIEQIADQIKGIKQETAIRAIFAGILEEKGLLVEAIQAYKDIYDIEPLPGIAYRISYCYDRLNLENFRNEWNIISKS